MGHFLFGQFKRAYNLNPFRILKGFADHSDRFSRTFLYDKSILSCRGLPPSPGNFLGENYALL